nr:MAG TPA: hypothetical protein [Caudoviricetes sp.]
MVFLKILLFFSSELDISYILSDSHHYLKASKINGLRRFDETN